MASDVLIWCGFRHILFNCQVLVGEVFPCLPLLILHVQCKLEVLLYSSRLSSDSPSSESWSEMAHVLALSPWQKAYESPYGVDLAQKNIPESSEVWWQSVPAVVAKEQWTFCSISQEGLGNSIRNTLPKGLTLILFMESQTFLKLQIFLQSMTVLCVIWHTVSSYLR